MDDNDPIVFWGLVALVLLTLAFLGGTFGFGPAATAAAIYVFFISAKLRWEIIKGKSLSQIWSETNLDLSTTSTEDADT